MVLGSLLDGVVRVVDRVELLCCYMKEERRGGASGHGLRWFGFGFRFERVCRVLVWCSHGSVVAVTVVLFPSRVDTCSLCELPVVLFSSRDEV